ncbi:hypothetical protein [Planobispora rosea]|uniref:Uncharacterized protein n=1 Tax=Planobispora rosea TaxID=35762 RepID=Q2MLT3_PLARO|nr:hypothetical protein [Planobispora rosea]ABC59119.1 hypothetical protein pPR2.5c [Planobispora rosea]
MTGPLIGSEGWRMVMHRAAWRCQCTRCPAHKRQYQGRCETESDEQTGVRLIAAPLDPGPDPLRHIPTVPVDQLRAWCPPCYDRLITDRRAQYRKEAEWQIRDRAVPLF